MILETVASHIAAVEDGNATSDDPVTGPHEEITCCPHCGRVPDCRRRLFGPPRTMVMQSSLSSALLCIALLVGGDLWTTTCDCDPLVTHPLQSHRRREADGSRRCTSSLGVWSCCHDFLLAPLRTAVVVDGDLWTTTGNCADGHLPDAVVVLEYLTVDGIVPVLDGAW